VSGSDTAAEGTARIEPLAAQEAETAAEHAGIPPFMTRLNVFRVLLRHPELARAVHDLLGVLLWHGSLNPRLRELIIMRLGWTTGSVYEWTQHWAIAAQLGVEHEDLLAVRDWRASARFGPAERAVLAATDEMVATGTVSDATWTQLTTHVATGPQHERDRVLLEVVGAIGTWRMVSSWLRSLRVPLEPDVAPWPPDGTAPPPPSPDGRGRQDPPQTIR